MTETVKEYRMPLMIGVGALVVALIIWAVLVSPQNSKLSSLQTQETQLQTQATGLQIKLASLKTEQQKLSGSCADLQKITTQIPSVQSPTDVDAEESSFESQFNALTTSSGVHLTQFSGFAPATTAATPTTSASGTATTPAGVTAVPTTLAVTGTFGEMSSFINGLDSFPRLFVIQDFVLAFGSSAATPSSASSSSSSASASVSTGGTPLWTGGVSTPSGTSPYSLAITGSIYYTSTPSALDACTKATAAAAATPTADK
jgi:Tfp pilus assembly protein PilO